jgi:uncharacterized membrane protein
MTLMILGLLAFTGLHLVPTLAPGTRSALQRRMGENGYKGVASLLVLLSVVLIVFGWRGTSPSLIYTPPGQFARACTRVDGDRILADCSQHAKISTTARYSPS